MRAGLRFVILNVPIGGDEGLPQSIQVGMAVGHMGRPVRRKATGSTISGAILLAYGRQRKQHQRDHSRDDLGCDAGPSVGHVYFVPAATSMRKSKSERVSPASSAGPRRRK